MRETERERNLENPESKRTDLK
ncbi:uncharacterized protein G2W53_043711 [Senna tora]|uniref:Uncharacterized protein n=1 Tax=Senna tora TaxID=362788 RepID=A0A834SLP3_9FABA|nr:uncharacterized protein G2W53_043711 [Senna tora]